jgi:REP element-mobilizing transposase RayT
VAKAHFRDDVDRLDFLRRLALAIVKAESTCVAFCLMGTHYHLIVDVPDHALPHAMHKLNLGYSRYFNRRHGLRGHAQFNRYGSRKIQGEDDLLKTFAYVAKNPVEAGLCEKPEDWRWSSYAGSVGKAQPEPFVDDALLLRSFRWPEVDARAQLRAHVEES